MEAVETESEIWDCFLKKSGKSLGVPDSTLLVVGDKDSGKSTVLRYLLENSGKGEDDEDDESWNSGTALGYTYFDVIHPEERDLEDVGAKVNVYSLSQPQHQSLLEFAFTPQSIDNTALFIVLDFSTPWTVMRSLRTWCKVLEDAVEAFATNSEGGAAVTRVRKRLRQTVATYASPAMMSPMRSPTRTTAPETPETPVAPDAVVEESDAPDFELAEGVLTHNIGLPIVFVCCKCDCANERAPPLVLIAADGAAIVYTSVYKDSSANKNWSTLHKYLLHRLYPEKFSFDLEPQVLDRQSVFVPSGWDSLSLVESLHHPKAPWRRDAIFEEVIKAPANPVLREAPKVETESVVGSPTASSKDIRAEPEQSWLERLMRRQERDKPAQTSVVTPNVLSDKAFTSSADGPPEEPISEAVIPQPIEDGPRLRAQPSASAGDFKKMLPQPSTATTTTASGNAGRGSKINPATADKAQIAQFFQGLLKKKGK